MAKDLEPTISQTTKIQIEAKTDSEYTNRNNGETNVEESFLRLL